MLIEMDRKSVGMISGSTQMHLHVVDTFQGFQDFLERVVVKQQASLFPIRVIRGHHLPQVYLSQGRDIDELLVRPQYSWSHRGIIGKDLQGTFLQGRCYFLLVRVGG